MIIPRPEYPRPQMQRTEWLNLNGTWQFDIDDSNRGLAEHWYENHTLTQSIQVPFAYQAKLSGIGTNDVHDIVWYRREFDVPATWNNQRIHLNFEAVDYRATVWVNGVFAVFHEGGHTPFGVDISKLLKSGSNTVVVRAEDVTTDRAQPRGKQYWLPESASIFYTRTTGIWQTVWLEPVGDLHVARLKLTPRAEAACLEIEYEMGGDFSGAFEIETQVSFAGQIVASKTVSVDNGAPNKVWASNPGIVQQRVSLGEHDNLKLWSPETPDLYDLTVRVKQNGALVDAVDSYFGVRTISLENGKFNLNGKPYYLKFVLDQGYHPDGILTFPSDEAIRHDIELTKAMGFNGARKHQKVEEPRFLYWADKMGLLVWGEMANCYWYSETAVKRITDEWQAAMRRDYNHPCIVAWVPMNESWGVPELVADARQSQHLASLYALTKSLDPTRPAVSNDGWEHARTDLLTIHDYEGSGEVLTERYASLNSTLMSQPAKRLLILPGFMYNGQPILLTEYGGIGYRKGEQSGWGYTTAENDDDFIQRYRAVVEAVYSSPIIQGYCYTQLTDVEQEINGLLTYDRQPKVPLEIIKQINDSNNA
ncbi:MAG: glycoside hydrolase family 2 TIM barrel-domain containing protein [Anaerolineae bacterium]